MLSRTQYDWSNARVEKYIKQRKKISYASDPLRS